MKNVINQSIKRGRGIEGMTYQCDPVFFACKYDFIAFLVREYTSMEILGGNDKRRGELTEENPCWEDVSNFTQKESCC
jgi:hypothetical protein